MGGFRGEYGWNDESRVWAPARAKLLKVESSLLYGFSWGSEQRGGERTWKTMVCSEECHNLKGVYAL